MGTTRWVKPPIYGLWQLAYEKRRDNERRSRIKAAQWPANDEEVKPTVEPGVPPPSEWTASRSPDQDVPSLPSPPPFGEAEASPSGIAISGATRPKYDLSLAEQLAEALTAYQEGRREENEQKTKILRGTYCDSQARSQEGELKSICARHAPQRWNARSSEDRNVIYDDGEVQP